MDRGTRTNLRIDIHAGLLHITNHDIDKRLPNICICLVSFREQEVSFCLVTITGSLIWYIFVWHKEPNLTYVKSLASLWAFYVPINSDWSRLLTVCGQKSILWMTTKQPTYHNIKINIIYIYIVQIGPVFESFFWILWTIHHVLITCFYIFTQWRAVCFYEWLPFSYLRVAL